MNKYSFDGDYVEGKEDMLTKFLNELVGDISEVREIKIELLKEDSEYRAYYFDETVDLLPGVGIGVSYFGSDDAPWDMTYYDYDKLKALPSGWTLEMLEEFLYPNTDCYASQEPDNPKCYLCKKDIQESIVEAIAKSFPLVGDEKGWHLEDYFDERLCVKCFHNEFFPEDY
jgi:hypothetical protein